jgi:hypothetical protein
MKQRKRIIKLILLGIVGVLVTIVYVHQYKVVNQRVKAAPVKEYSMGEEVEMGQDILMNYTMEGYSVCVNQAEVLTYEEFLKKYNAEDEYTYVPDKIYDVEITLRNKNADEETGINLSEFYVQGSAVSASIDTNLLSQVNPKLQGASAIALRKDSSVTIHMPFALYRDYFRKDVWEDLNDFNMNFVATLYPTKKVIHL